MSLNDGGLWCPRCGAEYRIGYITCTDCGVELTWERPQPKRVQEALREAEQDHDVVDYDLAEWAEDERTRLELLLIGAEIAHIWEGLHLLVSETREAEVDALVDEIENPGPSHRIRERRPGRPF